MKGLTLILLFICSACAGVSNNQDQVILKGEHYRLHVASPKLHGKIITKEARARRVGRFMQGEARIENVTQDRYTIEYKFEWFDSSGFSVESINMWHRKTLTAGEVVAVNSLGSHEQADTFHLTIRLPDDSFVVSP